MESIGLFADVLAKIKDAATGRRARTWGFRGAIALADQAAFAIAGFTFTVLLARWMGSREYGAFAYSYSIFFLIVGFHSVLFLEPISIFGVTRHEASFRAYWTAIERVHVLWAVLVALFVCAGSFVASRLGAPVSTVRAFYGLSFAQGAMTYYALVRRMHYVQNRPDRSFLTTLVYALSLLTIVSLLRVGWKIDSPLVAFLALGFAGVISGLTCRRVAEFSHEEQTRSVPIRKVARENWHYGGVLLLSQVMFWLTGGVYAVLTGSAISLSAAGALRALQNLVNPVQQAFAAFGPLFLTGGARRYRQNGISGLRRAVWVYTGVLVLLACLYLIVLFVAGSWLIHFLYDGKYDKLAWMLPLLGIGPLFSAVTTSWSGGLRIAGRRWAVVVVDVVGAFLTLTVGVFMIRHYGLVGAVAGILLSGAVRIPVLAVIWKMLNAD